MSAICFLNFANCFCLEAIKRLRRREPFFVVDEPASASEAVHLPLLPAVRP
jgi:hypothetical protein